MTAAQAPLKEPATVSWQLALKKYAILPDLTMFFVSAQAPDIPERDVFYVESSKTVSYEVKLFPGHYTEDPDLTHNGYPCRNIFYLMEGIMDNVPRIRVFTCVK